MDLILSTGERFKDARLIWNRHGKQTMAQVRAETGVSASMISDLENDRDRRVDYREIGKLAAHYGVSVDWLLGLTETRSPDPRVQAACRYTGLSENTVGLLRLDPDVSRVLNALSQSKRSPAFSQLANFARAFRRIGIEAAEAAKFLLSEDPARSAADAARRKEALELAVFHFSEVCREIPDKDLSLVLEDPVTCRDLIDLIGEEYDELYRRELRQFVADRQAGEESRGLSEDAEP